MGPIDFESRREQIKLSYTKSIKESEAKAAAKREQAAERERQRLEAEAAKLSAEYLCLLATELIDYCWKMEHWDSWVHRPDRLN